MIFRVLLLNLHRVTVTRHHIQPVVFEVNMQPRGSMYHKNHNGDGLLGPNSRMVVYMDPLGNWQVANVFPEASPCCSRSCGVR